MNIDLRHLEAFLAAAHYRSFTKAAHSVHVSQPTFTVQIRQLESELGVRLLDRNTRSVELTPVGRELLPALERTMRELKATLAKTVQSSKEKAGPVAIAVLPSLATTLLPQILVAMKNEHPGITIQLREAPARRIANMVKAQEVDFGIGWISGNDDELDLTPLFSDRMSAIFRAGHRLGRNKSVTLKELESLPLILMDRESSVRAMTDHAFAALGVFLKPAWEATYISTALALARAGLGVTILPSSALKTDGGSRLCARPIRGHQLDRSIAILQSHGRSLSPAADVLFHALIAGAKAGKAFRRN